MRNKLPKHNLSFLLMCIIFISSCNNGNSPRDISQVSTNSNVKQNQPVAAKSNMAMGISLTSGMGAELVSGSAGQGANPPIFSRIGKGVLNNILRFIRPAQVGVCGNPDVTVDLNGRISLGIRNGQRRIYVIRRGFNPAAGATCSILSVDYQPVGITTSFLLTENTLFIIEINPDGSLNFRPVGSAPEGYTFDRLEENFGTADIYGQDINGRIVLFRYSANVWVTTPFAAVRATFNPFNMGHGHTALAMAPTGASGGTEIDVCPNLNSLGVIETCNKYTINSSQQGIIDMANNSASLPPSAIPLALAISPWGTVYKSANMGISWDIAARLDLTRNMSLLNDIEYNENFGIFYIAGFDNSNNLTTLISLDGSYWQNTNIPSFTQVFATPDSYCALESTGRANCWGSNDHNKLGLGNLDSYTPAKILIPDKVGIAQDYIALSGGNYHMCGLRADSKSVDCWGAGALGDGVVHDPDYSTPVPTPVKIPTNVELPILSLVGGGTHECLLDSDNQVWCWGDNQYGEIDATSLQQSFPSPVIANYNQVHKYSAIASGDNFTCGLQNKLVNCWGKGFSSSTNPLYQITSSAPDFGNFSNISAGGNSTCILSNSINSGGTNLWCLGDNSYGQLGNGESGPFTLTPQEVKSNVADSSAHGIKQLLFSKVVQSSLNTCGLDANTNYAYCWGDNTYGQTGVLNLNKIVYEATSPIQINGSPGQFIDISIGTGSICLVGLDGNTRCLGNNNKGQLGVCSNLNVESEPFLVNTVVDSVTVTPESSSMEYFRQ